MKDHLDRLLKVGRGQREQKKAMLKALAFNNNVRRAADEAKIHTFMHYYWQARDAKYKEACETVQMIQNGVIKAELWDAATEGLDEPVIYRGKITGYFKRKSVEAMKTEARARMAEYREGGTTINVSPRSVSITLASDQAASQGAIVDLDSPIQPQLIDIEKK